MEDATRLPHLQPPPRSIGPGLTVRLLFGGFFGQFGWLFVAFGMLFVWLFDGAGGAIEAIRFGGDVVAVDGQVTDWKATSFNMNNQPVYETTFQYRHPNGSTAEGRSFATGSYLEEGTRVTIEYLDDDPATSRIEGWRSTPGGRLVLLTFIFPLVGLLFAAIGFRHGWRTHRLLTLGNLTRGVLATKEATNTRVNEQPVMKLTFIFEAEGGGSFEAVGKSHAPERMEDEAAELIIYDPSEPARAAVLDEFGCQPRVDGRGGFEASRPGLPTALLLLLPGLSVLILLRYVTSLL